MLPLPSYGYFKRSESGLTEKLTTASQLLSSPDPGLPGQSMREIIIRSESHSSLNHQANVRWALDCDLLIFYSVVSILLLQPRENLVEVFSMNANNKPLCVLGPPPSAMTTLPP